MDNTAANSVGFLGLLTLLFIAAKIFSAVTWPWIWVLAPAWIPTAIVAAPVIWFIVKVKRQARTMRKQYEASEASETETYHEFKSRYLQQQKQKQK